METGSMTPLFFKRNFLIIGSIHFQWLRLNLKYVIDALQINAHLRFNLKH